MSADAGPAAGQRNQQTSAPPVARRQNNGLQWRTAGGAFAAALASVAVLHFMTPGALPPAVQLLKASRLAELAQFQGEHQDRMLWGTYRPGLYFGARMRQPSALLAGLMWFDPDRPNAADRIRHNAQQQDGLGKYGWEAHDGTNFGRQELHDGDVHLTTQWTKRACDGCLGGDWALQVSARPNARRQSSAPEDPEQSEQQQRISILFYMADEGDHNLVHTASRPLHEGGARIVMDGTSNLLQGWTVSMDAPGASASRAVRQLAMRVEHRHNLTDLVKQSLLAGRQRKQLHLPGPPALLLPNVELDALPNLAVVQLTVPLPTTATFVFTASLPPTRQMPSRFVWVRQSVLGRALLRAAGLGTDEAWEGSLAQVVGGKERTQPAETHQQRVAALTGDALKRLQTSYEQGFNQRFERTFGKLDGPGLPAGTAQAARAALSNMLGGMGYFYGSSRVQVGRSQVLPSPPAALFTAVPSRSFFPRGFLWDEGFHQLLVQKWDGRMSREVLAHWLDLLNSQGWIAREQILGEEARARVPEGFVVQYPEAANPPTLFLPLASMAQQVAAASASHGTVSPELQEQRDFLVAAMPRLHAWLQWFNTSQAGPVPGSYRWRGRRADVQELNPKTLASGLDDYPRASHPSDQERHLDLLTWMALAARALATISQALPGDEGHEAYAAMAEMLQSPSHLESLHLDTSTGYFADWGNHTEDVRLLPVPVRGPTGEVIGREIIRKVTGQAPQPRFVPHVGYVSLFPLLMRLLPPDSPALGKQLQSLRDPELLWTQHGLRSLAKSSSVYNKRNTEHDPPYWRSPIWVNINYLTLAALDFYAKAPGPHQSLAGEIHDELRKNLLQNIVGKYQSSGFLWENYDDSDGHGRGCHPFSGWTALVVLIAGQRYFDL
ncbi:hypothetical protein WJX73_004307 [Symbiochloris irregularis]|uniref:Mannosyl-oligosaccharide glucosidase n=1 Tax=Symbiochloris irregularis TaxID=706552 RepID=A0AAW1PMN2_9CHLO